MDEESGISFIRIQDLNRESKAANLVGRVYNFSKIIEFKKRGGSPGKVVNVYLSDGTGVARLVLWDRQTAAVEEGNIKIGDLVQIVNGNVRESMFDSELDIVPGTYTSINLIENGNDHGVPSTEELQRKFLASYVSRIDIKDAIPGIFEIKGTVVDVPRGRNIFYSCPICGSKMNADGNAMVCPDHGEAGGQPVIVLNAVLDDGTGSIRAVFFRNAAEEVLEADASKFASMSEEERHSLIKEKLLGKDILVTGKVKKNELFDRTEIVVSDIKYLNVLEESKKLVEELEGEIINHG